MAMWNTYEFVSRVSGLQQSEQVLLDRLDTINAMRTVYLNAFDFSTIDSDVHSDKPTFEATTRVQLTELVRHACIIRSFGSRAPDAVAEFMHGIRNHRFPQVSKLATDYLQGVEATAHELTRTMRTNGNAAEPNNDALADVVDRVGGARVAIAAIVYSEITHSNPDLWPMIAEFFNWKGHRGIAIEMLAHRKKYAAGSSDADPHNHLFIDAVLAQIDPALKTREPSLDELVTTAHQLEQLRAEATGDSAKMVEKYVEHQLNLVDEKLNCVITDGTRTLILVLNWLESPDCPRRDRAASFIVGLTENADTLDSVEHALDRPGVTLSARAKAAVRSLIQARRLGSHVTSEHLIQQLELSAKVASGVLPGQLGEGSGAVGIGNDGEFVPAGCAFRNRRVNSNVFGLGVFPRTHMHRHGRQRQRGGQPRQKLGGLRC